MTSRSIRQRPARRSPRPVAAAAAGALVVLAAVWSAGAPAAGQPSELRVVRDPAQRFTIAVPAWWNVRTSSGDPAVVATSPARPGELPDSVAVIARDTIAGMSAEGCVKEAAQVMRVFGHIAFATVSEGPTTIGGLPGYTHAYTWRTRTGEDRWSLQVCVVVNREAFVITGTTTNTAARVEEEAPLLTRIEGTFKPAAAVRAATATPAQQSAGDRR